MYSVFSFIYGLDLTEWVNKNINNAETILDEIVDRGGIQSAYSGNGDSSYWIGETYAEIDPINKEFPELPDQEQLDGDWREEYENVMQIISDKMTEVTEYERSGQAEKSAILKELEHLSNYIRNSKPKKSVIYSTS